MRTRPILIAGNWKMNLGQQATRSFAKELQSLIKDDSMGKKLSGLVFASDITLCTALESFEKTSIQVGCQNAHWEDQGAFTGETSPTMLQEIGVKWTLVGHSERRQYFSETNETVKKRSSAHLKHGLKVVLCIGETRTEREKGETQAVIEKQLREGLPEAQSVAQGLSHLPERLFIAYEPVWAIGTGLTATPEQAEEAHAFIRKCLEAKYGADIAQKMLILYGGSVTPDNITGLLAQPNVDGGLVGGASLKPASYFSLLKAGAQA